MKKILLSFGLLLFVSGGVFAQKEYTYLKGQMSVFNDKFNEPRYVDVDSISYVYYVDKHFVDVIYPGGPSFEEMEDFIKVKEGHMLLKCSYEGLTDTLRYYEKGRSVDEAETGEYIRRYSGDKKLVYSSSVTDHGYYTDIEEKGYTYDAEDRISKITTMRNHDGAAEVMVYDTIKYDYESRQSSDALEYNLIMNSGYTSRDSVFVFYNDSGYLTLRNIPALGANPNRLDSVRYVFDLQGRLIKRKWSYKIISVSEGVSDVGDIRMPTTIEYRYTEDGYEEYENGVKKCEYKFQDDGYCMEINRYEKSDADVYPPISNLMSTEKFSYFKNGEIIAENGLIESNAPKVYGVQGGIIVITEKSLPVSVYTFSGGLMKQKKVSAGANTIPMAKGLYVVVIGSMSYKILVK